MRSLAIAAAALLFTAGLGGCGDDDGGPVDSGGGPVDSGGGPVDSGGGPVDSGSGTDSGTVEDAGGGTDAAMAGDTWDSFAMGFFATYCTACHAGGTRNYTTIDEVMRDAARIRCGVATTEIAGCGAGFAGPRQFPVGGGPHPTDPERDRLVAWIDSGLP